MLGCCHNSLRGFRWARCQIMDSYQHLGLSQVSSVHSLSHVSHPLLLQFFYTACPQAAPPHHLLVQQSPLEGGSSLSKALSATTAHSAQSYTVCSGPAHEVGAGSTSSPLLLILTPECKQSRSRISVPQLPAPAFAPSFLVLPKSRWVFLINWKRKIIPTHPAGMAAGISPECWDDQTHPNFFPCSPCPAQYLSPHSAQRQDLVLPAPKSPANCWWHPHTIHQQTHTQPSEFLLHRDPLHCSHSPGKTQHPFSSSVLQWVAQGCSLRVPTSTALSPPGPDTPWVSCAETCSGWFPWEQSVPSAEVHTNWGTAGKGLKPQLLHIGGEFWKPQGIQDAL